MSSQKCCFASKSLNQYRATQVSPGSDLTLSNFKAVICASDLFPSGGVPLGSPRREALGGGGGAGRGGGDGSEGGVERLHDVQLQQQIVFALRRLREDMRSVMERLEVVERLAGTHVSAHADEWCLQLCLSFCGCVAL